MVGALIYAIFNRSIISNGSYTFNLITTSVLKRDLETDFNTWNTCDCISNFNYYLVNPPKSSACSASSFVRKVWKYANSGAIFVGGAIKNKAPSSFPISRIHILFLNSSCLTQS